MTKLEIKEKIRALRVRSAWARGVKVYAEEILDSLEDRDQFQPEEDLEKIFLCGATSWKSYSWGGCSLIYDHEIAERLCTESEFKKTKGGLYSPNAREEWLDTQARALYQASGLLKRIIRG